MGDFLSDLVTKNFDRPPADAANVAGIRPRLASRFESDRPAGEFEPEAAPSFETSLEISAEFTSPESPRLSDRHSLLSADGVLERRESENALTHKRSIADNDQTYPPEDRKSIADPARENSVGQAREVSGLEEIRQIKAGIPPAPPRTSPPVHRELSRAPQTQPKSLDALVRPQNENTASPSPARVKKTFETGGPEERSVTPVFREDLADTRPGHADARTPEILETENLKADTETAVTPVTVRRHAPEIRAKVSENRAAQMGRIERQAAPAPEPVINITIGRVEVRAVNAPPPREAPTRSRATSLEDYLQNRRGGKK